METGMAHGITAPSEDILGAKQSRKPIPLTRRRNQAGSRFANCQRTARSFRILRVSFGAGSCVSNACNLQKSRILRGLSELRLENTWDGTGNVKSFQLVFLYF
jgi:hypothetical protein